MNTRAITSAAGVIHAAIQQGRVPAGIACALDDAGLLNSPERAADLVKLRARITELEQLLAEVRSTEEDPIAYTLTPQADPEHLVIGLSTRQDMLLAAIRTARGEWTTRRVQKLYAQCDVGAPRRSTARRDLHTLHSAGLLIEHDLRGRRHYTLAQDGAR